MAATYLQKLRIFSRDTRLYLGTAALFGFTVFGGIYSVLLNLYLLRLGYGPRFIGLMNAAVAGAFALFSVPAGAIGGRWDMRHPMIIGLALTVLSCGLLPMSRLMRGGVSPAWLVTTYGLSGIGMPLYMVNADAFLAGCTSSDERAHAFSVVFAVWPLAGFAGSLVGGLLPSFVARLLAVPLDDPVSYGYPLLLAALALMPAVFIMLATEGTSVGREGPVSTAEGSAPYLLILVMGLAVLFGIAARGAARSFLNVYLDDRLHVPTAQIGTLVAVGQVLPVPAALVAPLLMERWGKGTTFVSATVGTAIALLPIALIRHVGGAALGFLGLMALGSVTTAANTVYSQELVPPRWRAPMAGTVNMAVGVGFAATAIAGGHIIGTLGYRGFFLIAAALTVAGALLFWGYFRVPRGELARAAVLRKAGQPDQEFEPVGAPFCRMDG